MRLMGTAEDPADPICELVSIEQPLGFCDLPLAVHPLGFYGVKPRTLGGQEARDYAYSTAAFFDLAIVGADPVAHPTAFVPARVVPDQQQGLLAPLFELVAAPLKKLRGYGAHGTAIHESKPRPVEPRHIQPVAGEGFGVGIVLPRLLLEQVHGAARLLPGMQARPLEARKPALKSQKPKTHSGWLRASRISRSRALFFSRTPDPGSPSISWPAPNASPAVTRSPG